MGRRVLAILLLLPLVVSAQNIGGRWQGEVLLLPSPPRLVSNILELDLSWSEWSLISSAEFLGADGWVWQEFTVKGILGPVDIESVSLFGPAGPVFLYQMLKASIDYGGAAITLYSAYVSPDVPGVYFTGGPSGGTVLEIETSLNDLDVEAEIGFGARLTDPWAPFSINYTGVGTYTKGYLVDPFPGGFEFTYLELAIKDIPFICCDIKLDFAFAFTKDHGFDHVKFTLKDLFQLCCDLSFDVSVTFRTDSKEVSVGVNWPGIEGCVAVYGDAQFANNVVEGLEIHGFMIYCELAECYSVEFLTAFDVAEMEMIIGDVFKGDEFEYAKLTACGPACCGGTWDLSLTVFFQDVTGPLFGLSRFLVEVSVPLMDALTITTSLEIAIPTGPSLTVGWDFSL